MVNSMMDRIGLMNAFPQITQRDGRLEMEQLNHTELAVNHRIGRIGASAGGGLSRRPAQRRRLGMGPTSAGVRLLPGIPCPILPEMALSLMAANYQSSGFRAVYAQTFGSRVEVLGVFSSGSALSARSFNCKAPSLLAGDV